jgi:hypothetical protein
VKRARQTFFTEVEDFAELPTESVALTVMVCFPVDSGNVTVYFAVVELVLVMWAACPFTLTLVGSPLASATPTVQLLDSTGTP